MPTGKQSSKDVVRWAVEADDAREDATKTGSVNSIMRFPARYQFRS